MDDGPQKLKVLLVDDMSGKRHQFEMLFKSLGIDSDILQAQPERQFEFLGGAPIPREKALESFDVALIDLEFFYPPDATLPESKRLQGGSEALPVLRKEAPWLPVIAESRLIDGKSPELISIAASFGFDGLFPQSLLNPANPFNRDIWDRMYLRAVFQRRLAAIGSGYDGATQLDDITISPADREPWSDKAGVLETLFRHAFYFARELSITAVKPGLSGARVYRAVVTGGEQQDARPGYWLVKLSRSPWKLNRELNGHLAMVRSGGESAIMVPLLWRGVLVERGVGLIAYQFATGTVPAADRKEALPVVMNEVATLLRRFYPVERSLKASNRDVVLRKFGPNPGDLAKTIGKLPDSFQSFAKAVVDEKDGTLARPISYRSCRIHGDLHLDNIMLGEVPVLIDLAWSKVGPVAADAARLTADVLIRHPELRESKLPPWGGKSKVEEVLQPAIDVFRLEGDDVQLFSDFLSLFLWEFLGYDTTDNESRTWICEVLESRSSK